MSSSSQLIWHRPRRMMLSLFLALIKLYYCEILKVRIYSKKEYFYLRTVKNHIILRLTEICFRTAKLMQELFITLILGLQTILFLLLVEIVASVNPFHNFNQIKVENSKGSNGPSQSLFEPRSKHPTTNRIA